MEFLGSACDTGDVQVLAYCLMSNHVHLVVVQGPQSLERFTKSLHTAFAQWSHRASRGSHAKGPVFAARPRTTLVESEPYLLELVRYVHNNPVRAKVVKSARASRWSSHLEYVGQRPAAPWLNLKLVLSCFGRSPKRAADRFDAFVEQGKLEVRRPELSGGVNALEARLVQATLSDGHRLSDGVLGSDAFVERVRADARRVEAPLSKREGQKREGRSGRPSARQVVDAVLALHDVEPYELDERPKSQASASVKRLAIWVWLHEYEGKQIEIARVLNLDTSMVSRYYGQGMRIAGELDQLASGVTALLRKKKRLRGRATDTRDGLPVRYHVDVDET